MRVIFKCWSKEYYTLIFFRVCKTKVKCCKPSKGKSTNKKWNLRAIYLLNIVNKKLSIIHMRFKLWKISLKPFTFTKAFEIISTDFNSLRWKVICYMCQQIWVPIHTMHDYTNSLRRLTISLESISMKTVKFRITILLFLDTEKSILYESFFWKYLSFQRIWRRYFQLMMAFIRAMIYVSLFAIVKMIEKLFRWFFLLF